MYIQLRDSAADAYLHREFKLFLPFFLLLVVVHPFAFCAAATHLLQQHTHTFTLCLEIAAKIFFSKNASRDFYLFLVFINNKNNIRRLGKI